MSNILIVYAHPEPKSLTRQLVDLATDTLKTQGHKVTFSDLYGMKWNPVYGPDDFANRLDPERLNFVAESDHAFRTHTQPAEVVAEQEKILSADALILQFPLWWFSMPAIMKGWIDRVWAYGLAYGYKGAGNRYRYGEGGFAGRRVLVSVTTGGPAVDYAPRGINGPLDELLFPLTHGSLFFPGMDVLPLHTIYGTGHISAEEVIKAKEAYRARLLHLFEEKPIAYRAQNNGDYPDRHILADSVAPGMTGIKAHIAA